jgi:phosphoglucosamine mutase
MREKKYFGTDGIRGRVGNSPITPAFIMRLGWAAGKVFAKQGTNKVIIGKDTRISGYMLESALEAGFSAAGVDVELLGPMPTPGVAYLTRTFRASAGVVISASHNPFYDNGIKFFSAKGEKLSDDEEFAIEDLLDQEIECVEPHLLGKAYRRQDADARYIEYCKSNFPTMHSLEGIKMVVDCANGAAYHIAPDVFRELGAEVIEFATTPNGININEKCGATNTKRLQELVIEHQADVGIALDGDADRLMMVDHTGYLLNGDELVYIIAKNDKESGRLKGGVVGTVMSNLGLELALKEIGIPFSRSGVGDRYVMEMLNDLNWNLGAEGSGHIINMNHNTTGDGIIASLNVLTALIKQKETLYEARQSLKIKPQVLINVAFCQGTDPLANKSVQEKISTISTLLEGRGRVLIRKSGTEPLIRVMVENDCCEEGLSSANDIADSIKLAS